MVQYTRLQIKNIVKNELDLNDEVFISDTELNDYVNKAIDRAEQEIIKIREDYFLTSANLSIVAGTSEYALPSDIYANKIRGIMYENGTIIYPIRRIRDWNKFEKKALSDFYASTNAEYQYLIRHVYSSATSIAYKIALVPTAQETSATAVTIWYTRNSARLTDDTHVCDVPEALNFIIAHIKKECLAKEFGGVAPPEAVAEVEMQAKLLVDTLTEAQPDNLTEVEQDLSHYSEHV